MSYVTQADLERRFGTTELAQLTDRSAGTMIDADVVAQAIADAAARIDGYLAARYALPLAVVPPALALVAADIARYLLWGDRASEQVRKRYDDAVATLRAVAAGTFRVDGAAPLVTAAGGNNAAFTAPSRSLAFSGRR